MEEEGNDRVVGGLCERTNAWISKAGSCVINWSPTSWLSHVLIRFLIPLLVWAVLYVVVGKKDALPGGSVFAIYVVLIFGLAFGELFSYLRMPALLGMLTLGILIRNVPHIQFASSLDKDVSSILRQLALTVILIRAGLGLDPVALMRLKGVVIRLAFFPCIVEAFVVALAAHFILSFPWLWGLLLGFVLAAVSPAVIVPSLLSLGERGYGVAKGIPTIVIAASSVDDILAISAFGLVLGLNFSESESILGSIIQGPLELILGMGFGLLWGSILGVFFSQPESTNRSKNATVLILRVLLTLGGGCLSVFGFQVVGYPGSGALGCLVATFVAAVFWRHKGVLNNDDNLSESFSFLWYLFQPLLFGLIGCEIDLSKLDPTVAALGVLCLAIGLLFRVVVTFFTVANAGLNVKERLFVAIAWVPKATVQAALGPIALGLARDRNAGPEAEELGLQVLTIAVLVILITAPIGAIAVMNLGPILLTTNQKSSKLGSPSNGQALTPIKEKRDEEEALNPQETPSHNGHHLL